MVKILLITILFFSSTSFARELAYSENGKDPWGRDSDLASSAPTKVETQTYSVGNKVCQSMIRFFQVYISPIDGPRSSYLPSSSQYTLLAIQKYGVLQGICLGCDRLMRENHDAWVYETTHLQTRSLKYDPVR